MPLLVITISLLQENPGGTMLWMLLVFVSSLYVLSVVLAILAPAVCKADPDGITIHFFSNTIKSVENVRGKEINEIFFFTQFHLDAETVKKLFQEYEPDGSTDLAAVLNLVFSVFKVSNFLGVLPTFPLRRQKGDGMYFFTSPSLFFRFW